MNDKIKALVLSVNDYQENDLILQVITEDKSFLTLIGKGAKKLNAKHHFVSLCVYEFIIDYKDNKTMYGIHGSKLLKSYYEDHNFKLLAFKNILIELTLKTKELYEIDLYKNIIFCLDKINDLNMYLIGSLYLAYILKIFGIYPIVDSCVVCDNKKVVAISNKLGGFLCKEHLGQNKILNINELRKFRLINKATFVNYNDIKDIDFVVEDFDNMIHFFIENSDLNIKSYHFYKQMFV